MMVVSSRRALPAAWRTWSSVCAVSHSVARMLSTSSVVSSTALAMAALATLDTASSSSLARRRPATRRSSRRSLRCASCTVCDRPLMWSSNRSTSWLEALLLDSLDSLVMVQASVRMSSAQATQLTTVIRTSMPGDPLHSPPKKTCSSRI